MSQPASTLYMSHSSSRKRARCERIDSGAQQHSFSAYQDKLDFAGVDLVGHDISNGTTFKFEWGKSMESKCMETTSGHQLGFTTYRAASQDLVSGGIVLCGDSTIRFLFASICGFHSGMSREELDKYNGVLKERSGAGEVEHCKKANISFAPWYKAREPDICIDTIRTTKAKYKFVGMPGLHTLWSPGDREEHGTICTYRTLGDIKETLSRAVSSLTPHGVLFGTAVAVCDEKTGQEGRVCQIYKLQRELAKSGGRPTDARTVMSGTSYDSSQVVSDFVASETNRLVNDHHIDWSTGQQVAAWLRTVNSTGIISPRPWLHCATSTLLDDGYDSFLFQHEGMRHFNDIAMQLLEKYPDSLVVDMHGATEGRCDHTGDGHHYRDPVLLLQASLLATAWKLQELLAK